MNQHESTISLDPSYRLPVVNDEGMDNEMYLDFNLSIPRSKRKCG